MCPIKVPKLYWQPWRTRKTRQLRAEWWLKGANMGSENRGVEGLIGDQPQKYDPSLLVPILYTNDPGVCVKLKYVAHYALSKNRSTPVYLCKQNAKHNAKFIISKEILLL